MKRGGGRRYYRREDVELLRGIRWLLYNGGWTIKGLQRILLDSGVEYVRRVGPDDGIDFSSLGHLLDPADRVVIADTDKFTELLRVGGLDPKKHLRFADWSGIDFSGDDLRDFDFTGARLHDCRFDGALIDGARFDQAEINGADLRASKDWEAHVHNWTPPEQPINDWHLPIGAVFQDAPFAPEMIVVPAGEFWMGAGDQEAETVHEAYDEEMANHLRPQHRQVIPAPIAVGRYPITRAEFQRFVNASRYKIPKGANFTDVQERIHEFQENISWKKPGYRQNCRHPVTCVSWIDAYAYVKWLNAVLGVVNYRLLSEAEWEYCCRAGTQTKYCVGDTLHSDQANFGTSGTIEVGAYSSNAFGLFDMHGNIWEWVEDSGGTDYREKPEELKSSGGAWHIKKRSDFRGLRGGGWTDDEVASMSAYRNALAAGGRDAEVGFRIARNLTL